MVGNIQRQGIRMPDQNIIQDRITTIIGFVGILLALLANAVTTLKTQELGDRTTILLIQVFTLATVYFLMTSIITGFSILIDTSIIKANNPEKLLKLSYKYFLYGLIFTAFTIIIILIKSPIWSGVCALFIICSIVITLKHINKITASNNKQSMNYMQDEELMYYALILAILICFLIIPNNEKGTAGLSALASLIAVGSLIFSHRAFKQTDTTLIKTEREQQIRDIEKSFDFFYYPLRDYIEYPLKILSDDSLEKSPRKQQDIENIAHYRYLATDETREQFEIYQNMGFPLNKEHKEDIQNLLDHVTDDINVKQIDLEILKKLNQTIKSQKT